MDQVLGELHEVVREELHEVVHEGHRQEGQVVRHHVVPIGHELIVWPVASVVSGGYGKDEVPPSCQGQWAGPRSAFPTRRKLHGLQGHWEVLDRRAWW